MTVNDIEANWSPELLLKPHAGCQPGDWRELWLGRELFAFLVWRDITDA
jgi:hypothetical protein